MSGQVKGVCLGVSQIGACVAIGTVYLHKS